MAKFNITVELDWVDEEGTIDEALKEQLAAQIISKVSASAIKDITKKVDEQICAKVNTETSEKLAEALSDFLNKPRTITNKWGEVDRDGVSVLQMMKDACDNYLEQEVDDQGRKPDGYTRGKQKRIDFIISQQIDYKLKSAVDSAAKRIRDGIQKYVQDTIQDKLSENISKAIGLEQIVKSMQ